MPEVVDDAVVKLEFDNGQYNKNVQESITYTEALKESIDFSGLKNSFTPLLNGVNELRGGFSTASVVAISLMNRLTNDMVNGAQKIINYAIRPLHTMMSNLTSIPMKSGLEEYEMKMNSIQTIMASTGESIETVNKHLDELNKYSDLTIYSFRDMTANIGKFTNAGVKLDVAVNAMKGLLNEAALSGANANEASRAMYNLAQSLSMGYVQYIDWKSIENANMATIDFKKNLAQTAVEMGKLKKGTDGLYSTGKHTFTLQQLFKDGMKDQWLQSEVLTTTLEKYTDTTTELGRKAQAAAQDMKTFSQMMQTIKEALQSGWAGTWQQIFGDLIEAKTLWTTIGGSINDLIGKFDDFRNTILKTANSLPHGFRKNLIASVFNVLTGLGRVLDTVRSAFISFINSVDGRKTISLTRKIAQWVSELSVKVKDLSEIFLINADTQRTLHAVFRATFTVGELVWRVFTELGASATDLTAKAQPLITAFRNLVLLAAIFTTAGADWLMSSGKITSAIDFIKDSVVASTIAIGGAIKSLADSKMFISFIDSIKVAVKQLLDFINGFSVNFKGTSFEWLAEIFESLKNQEFNVDQFETVLARIFGGINNVASKVLAGLPTILAPVYNAFVLIMTFVKNVLLTMDAQSLAEFAKILVELIRLPAQLIKWNAIKDLVSGASDVLHSVGSFIRDWGSMLKAQAVTMIVDSFTYLFSALGNIFLKLGVFVGIMVGTAYAIKKFDILPQFLLVMGSLAAFIIGLTLLSKRMNMAGSQREAQSFAFGIFSTLKEIEGPLGQITKLITKMTLTLAAITASAYILKDVDNAVETILSLSAGVIALTGAAAYIVSVMDSPEMTMVSDPSVSYQIIDRISMIKKLVDSMTIALIGIGIAARVAGKGNWSSIAALTGGVILITAFASELASRISTVNSLGFDVTTFNQVFGMINAVLASMVISMGLFGALSNLIGSIGKYTVAVLGSITLFVALEGLYWGATKLVGLDWSSVANVLAACAVFIGEMSYTIGAFGLLSRLIGSIPKFLAAILGVSTLFFALEGLTAALAAVSKLLTTDTGQIWEALGIFSILSGVGIAMFAFFTVIEGLVSDVGKYFKMILAFDALIGSIEVIMLSLVGIGYLISQIASIKGVVGAVAGMIGGLAGLAMFAAVLTSILAGFASMYAILEAFGGTEKFTKFLDDISKFFLNLAVLTFALDVAGVLAIGALGLLVPLALLPAMLGMVIGELAALAGVFGESMKSINTMTSDGVDIFENIKIITEKLNEIAGIVVPAESSISGLVPVLGLMIPVFGLLEVLSLIFTVFGNTKEAADNVLKTLGVMIPICQRISDISDYARDSLKGIRSLMILLPLMAVVATEFSKIIPIIDGKFDNVKKPFKRLLDVFKFISVDVANGIKNTAKSLNAIGSIDIMSLIKTALIGKIASVLNSFIPWMKDLEEFMMGLTAFASRILEINTYTSRIKDWNGVTNLLSVVDKIVEAMGKFRIQSLSTVIGIFIGSNDLGDLGKGLATFAESIKDIGTSIEGADLSENGPIDKLVDFVSRLTRSMMFLNMRTGLSGLFSNLMVGTNSLKVLGDELLDFATYLVRVSDILTFEVSGIDTSDWEMMEKAVDFIHTVVTKTAGVWNFGEGTDIYGSMFGLFGGGSSSGSSLIGKLLGNNSIGELGKRLYEYGVYFKKFYQEVNSIDMSPEKLKRMTDTIQWLSDNMETISRISTTIMTIASQVLVGTATMIYTIVDMFDDTDEQIETGFDRFMNHLNRLINNIGVILSITIDAFTEPLNAISPMVTSAFEHMEQPLIDMFAFLSSSIGNTEWLNTFASTIERVAAAIKDLTNNAIIPLLQNGLIPLEKIRMQSKLLPQLASIIKLLIILASIIAGIIALGLAVKLGVIILLIAAVVKGVKGVMNVISLAGTIISAVVEFIGEKVRGILDEIKKKWDEVKQNFEDVTEPITSAFNIKIDVLNSPMGQSIISDFEIIGQIIHDTLINAVENAIKYSPTGAAWELGKWAASKIYDNGTAQTQHDAAMDSKGKPSRSGTGFVAGTKIYGRKQPEADFTTLGELDGEKAKQEYNEAYWKAYAESKFGSNVVAYQEKAAANDEHFWENYVKTHDSKGYNYLQAQGKYAGSTAANEYLKYLNKGMEESWSHEYAHVNNYKNDEQYQWLKSILTKYLGWNDDILNKALNTLDTYYPKIRSGMSSFGDLFGMFGEYTDVIGGTGMDKMIEEMTEGLNGLTDGLGDYGDKTAALQEKQLLSESAYWAQLLEIKKQGVDGVKYQDMSLADFEEQTLNTINSLYDNYINEINSKMSSFAGGSIFSKVDWGFDAENPFTKNDLFGNLQDQIDQLDRYSNVMMSLNDRIDNEGLRKAINDMGVDSIEELETLNSLTEAELDNYEAMYVSKMESATRAATVATQATYDQTMAAIADTIGMPDVSPEMIEQWFDGTLTSLDSMMSSMGLEFGKVGTNISAGIADGMTNDESKKIIEDAHNELGEEGLEDAKEYNEIESPSRLYEREVGEMIPAGIAKGMVNDLSISKIKASVALVCAWYKSEFNEKIGDFYEIGENLMKGLERGIHAGSLAASYATGVSADEITNVYVRKFGIHSPSTVFEAFGNYLMEGLSLGVKNGTPDAEKTMEQSANSTLGIMQSAVERAYAAMNSESVPAITPVINMNKFQNGIRNMDTALAAQRSYLMANAANASIDTSVHKEVSINNQAAVDAITRLNGDILNLGDRLANMQIMLDTGIVAGQMAPAMNSELGTLMSRSIREGVG